MNCRTFRKQFHHLLDIKQSHLLTSEMSVHLKSCPGCAAHSKAMEKIDTALRNMPDVEVPVGLVERLEAIPSIYSKPAFNRTWRGEIRHTAIYLVPVALVVILSLTLAPHFQFVIQTALVTLAFITIVLQRIGLASGAS